MVGRSESGVAKTLQRIDSRRRLVAVTGHFGLSLVVTATIVFTRLGSQTTTYHKGRIVGAQAARLQQFSPFTSVGTHPNAIAKIPRPRVRSRIDSRRLSTAGSLALRTLPPEIGPWSRDSTFQIDALSTNPPTQAGSPPIPVVSAPRPRFRTSSTSSCPTRSFRAKPAPTKRAGLLALSDTTSLQAFGMAGPQSNQAPGAGGVPRAARPTSAFGRSKIQPPVGLAVLAPPRL
jgi:hypothetical protein